MSIKYKIVPLVWTCDQSSLNSYLYAESVFGDYVIKWKTWKDVEDCTLFGPNDFTVNNIMVETAKQNAQKHFEDKVREVLATCIIRNKEHE